MKTETEIGVMHLQPRKPKMASKPPEDRKRQGNILPWSLQRERGSANALVLNLGFQNSATVSFSSKPPSLWHFVGAALGKQYSPPPSYTDSISCQGLLPCLFIPFFSVFLAWLLCKAQSQSYIHHERTIVGATIHRCLIGLNQMGTYLQKFVCCCRRYGPEYRRGWRVRGFMRAGLSSPSRCSHSADICLLYSLF